MDRNLFIKNLADLAEDAANAHIEFAVVFWRPHGKAPTASFSTETDSVIVRAMLRASAEQIEEIELHACEPMGTA